MCARRSPSGRSSMLGRAHDCGAPGATVVEASKGNFRAAPLERFRCSPNPLWVVIFGGEHVESVEDDPFLELLRSQSVGHIGMVGNGRKANIARKGNKGPF